MLEQKYRIAHISCISLAEMELVRRTFKIVPCPDKPTKYITGANNIFPEIYKNKKHY